MKVSNGATLTPPLRVVTQARTLAGAGQSGALTTRDGATSVSAAAAAGSMSASELSTEAADAVVAASALDRHAVRERAASRFGVERMVDDYLAVYERLV